MQRLSDGDDDYDGDDDDHDGHLVTHSIGYALTTSGMYQHIDA